MTPELAMNSSAVVADRISKRFGPTGALVLRDVTLRLPPGRCTAVLGPSGSGKTVLMRCLAGLERPTHGSVRIAGTDLATLTETELTEYRRDRIGTLYRGGNLLSELNALDNALLPLDIAGRRPDPALFDDAVDTLAVRDLMGRRTNRLTLAEQQRIALLRAVLQEPDLLLADDPVGKLDALTARALLRVLRRCTDRYDLSTVMFTAQSSTAYANRTITLDNGEVVQDRELLDERRCGTGGRSAERPTEHIA